MNDDGERLIVVLGVVLAAWYLWTQTTLGSSLAGVTTPIAIPGVTTATGAPVNVLAGLSSSIANLFGSVITKGAGNAPATTVASPYGAGANNSYDVFGNTVYGSPAGVTPSVSPGDPTLSTTVPFLAWTDPTSLLPTAPPTDTSGLAFTDTTPTLADYQDVG